VVIDGESMNAEQALARPGVTVEMLEARGFFVDTAAGTRDGDVSTIEAELKYRGYLKRDEVQRARTLAQEQRAIPADMEYRGMPGLSREVVERLSSVRPATIGQAGRVTGVTPAALAIVARSVAKISNRARCDD